MNTLGSSPSPCSCFLRAPLRPQWRPSVSHVHPSAAACTASNRQRGTAYCQHSALTGCPRLQPRSRQRVSRRRQCRGGALVARASLQETLIGLGIFFTPSIVAVIYAYFKGKGNVKDGLSRMLTVRQHT